MTLEAHYSKISHAHHGSGRKILEVRDWPRNRHEAAVFVAGTGSRVLDVGCGNGLMLWNLRERYHELFGLELSSSMLEAAQNTLGGAATVLRGDVVHMPFESGSMDTILCTDVIEHIPDVWSAFAELRRVASPGGSLVITTPNVAYARHRLKLLRGRFPVTSGHDEGLIPGGGCDMFAGGHCHYFTFRSLALNLQKFGFEVVRRLGYGRLGKVHDLWPSLLSGGICMVARRKGADRPASEQRAGTPISWRGNDAL